MNAKADSNPPIWTALTFGSLMHACRGEQFASSRRQSLLRKATDSGPTIKLRHTVHVVWPIFSGIPAEKPIIRSSEHPRIPRPAFFVATVLTMPFATRPGGQPGEIRRTESATWYRLPSFVDYRLIAETGRRRSPSRVAAAPALINDLSRNNMPLANSQRQMVGMLSLPRVFTALFGCCRS